MDLINEHQDLAQQVSGIELVGVAEVICGIVSGHKLLNLSEIVIFICG